MKRRAGAIAGQASLRIDRADSSIGEEGVRAMAVKFEEVKSDWVRRGYSCDVWTDPPGQVWRDYVHRLDELLMVMEGELELEIAGRPHRARPGEEYFIPAGATHTVRNVGGTTARWLYGYRSSGGG